MQICTRYFTIGIVTLLSVGGALFSHFATAADSVKVGTVTWIGYGPFYVADQFDLFKKSGVKVAMQIFADPALIPAAVASGSVDAGMVTYDQVISQVAKGVPSKVVMPIDYSNGGDAIVATKDITKVSDFKGQKVAFNPLSPSDFLLSYALQTNNLTEKDVTPVNMTPEAVPAAMASGGVKIGVTYEPTVSQVVGMDDGKKYHMVFSSKDAPGLITDVLIAKTSYIKQNPKIIKALIQGYVDGLAYMKSNPADAAKLIGKVMGVSDKEVMEQLPAVYNPTLEEFPKVFDKSDETTSFYTSGADVLDAVNAVFASTRQLNGFVPHRACDDQLEGAVHLLPLPQTAEGGAQPPSPEEGLRDLLAMPQPSEADVRRALEAGDVARGIRAMVAACQIQDGGRQRPAEFRDVMILTRGRKQLRGYEFALRAAGIPYASARQGGLLDSLEAHDLMALLQFLLRPSDDLIWSTRCARRCSPVQTKT